MNEEKPKQDWRTSCTVLAGERAARVTQAIFIGEPDDLETEMIKWQQNKAHFRRTYGDEGHRHYVHAFAAGLKAYAESYAEEQRLHNADVFEQVMGTLKDFMEKNRFHS